MVLPQKNASFCFFGEETGVVEVHLLSTTCLPTPVFVRPAPTRFCSEAPGVLSECSSN